MKKILLPLVIGSLLASCTCFGDSNSSDVNNYHFTDNTGTQEFNITPYLTIKNQQHIKCNNGVGIYVNVACWTFDAFDKSDHPDPIDFKVTDLSHPGATCNANSVPFVIGEKDAVQHSINITTTEDSSGQWSLKCSVNS